LEQKEHQRLAEKLVADRVQLEQAAQVTREKAAQEKAALEKAQDKNHLQELLRHRELMAQSNSQVNPFLGSIVDQQIRAVQQELDQLYQNESLLLQEKLTEQQETINYLKQQIRNCESQIYGINESVKKLSSSEKPTSKSSIIAAKALQDLQTNGTEIDKLNDRIAPGMLAEFQASLSRSALGEHPSAVNPQHYYRPPPHYPPYGHPGSPYPHQPPPYSYPYPPPYGAYPAPAGGPQPVSPAYLGSNPELHSK